ncbi:hypothetical protein Ddye_001599 [Dipteronia dyeriana]|uniref:HAT C-terminal dimerisation domain-containing protein n=1 Tax=Dipteronia dyeriana TaxID=168575 RepID=A0AAE0CTI9_9ROSI|nr:hypothetical protein Ddye_001599 [Dipteronia dyeriana]
MNKLLIIAAVLDLMYKLQYMSYCFAILYGVGSREPMTTNIKDALVELYIVEKQNNVRGRNKVERYLLEPVERKHPNFDVLTWWNVNSAHYPISVLIAKDVFAMSISTVASKSAFSGGGRVLDSF